jgi:uncharacterized membrane protein
MEKLTRAGQYFYGIGIVGIGILQIIYAAFRPMLLPYWPAFFPNQAVCAYIAGAALVLAGVFIILNKKLRTVCLALGICFFLLFLFHAYNQLLLVKGEFQLATWTNPLKVLTFSGGALIIAASFTTERSPVTNKQLLLPGRIFFSIMLIVFGIDHFQYAKFVALLVPGWIPGPMFWTYFAAVALIGSGIGILFNIRVVAFLCAIMLFLWLIVLHIPLAIDHPNTAEGNEITSAFQALAFSGIAFVLVGVHSKMQIPRASG